MRRIAVVLVSVLATLGMLAPPCFAQPPAAAPPAPKVTITGLVDFATTVYKNTLGGDITTSSVDHGWYSRERGVFTVTGEVGRVKGVLALEFDLVNGAMGNAGNVANAPNANSNLSLNGGNVTAGGAAETRQSTTNFDFGTDVNDTVELKWLYVEAPITGAGSLLPFIPVPSIGRFGAQPLSGHEYKPGIFAVGDFAGANLVTTWAPNLRTTLTYIQLDEALRDETVAGLGGAHKTEDMAFVASAEFDVFKGLTVKPGYSYARFDGGSNTRLANTGRGGFNPNAHRTSVSVLPAAAGPFQTNKSTTRHTFGGEARWTAGPWSLAPSFFYQTGEQEVGCELIAGCVATTNRTREVDISSWIFDVIGGFRTGPLTIEGRFSWTPGMPANQCVQATAVCRGGSDIGYYQPLNADPSWWSGWAEIETSNIDYIMTTNPNDGTRLGGSPSYDKYGRIIFGFAVDYAVTPALAVHLYTNWQWTDEKVDVHATTAAQEGLTPVSRGEKSYLGNEWAAGLTYRFAPNVAFDLIGAILFVGAARDNGRGVSTGAAPLTFDADNVYKGVARMRVTF